MTDKPFCFVISTNFKVFYFSFEDGIRIKETSASCTVVFCRYQIVVTVSAMCTVLGGLIVINFWVDENDHTNGIFTQMIIIIYQVLLLNSLQDPVPRKVFDYVLKSNVIEKIFAVLQERKYMRDISRQGHKPAYPEMEESLVHVRILLWL